MKYTREQLHKVLIELASLSPAKKRKVAAVIVRETPEGYALLCSGYNYNPTGLDCEDANGNTYDTVVHAEVACLSNLPTEYHNDPSLKMYVTHPPCANCQHEIKLVGISYEVEKEFMKFDAAKPRFALVPVSLVEGVAEVLTYGAKKYKVNNWRKTPDVECYISALERHMAAWKSGQDLDPESGFHHLKHVACNVAFLLELKDLPKVKE